MVVDQYWLGTSKSQPDRAPPRVAVNGYIQELKGRLSHSAGQYHYRRHRLYPNGTVPNYLQYLEAADAARRVAGMADVHNHSEVRHHGDTDRPRRHPGRTRRRDGRSLDGQWRLRGLRQPHAIRADRADQAMLGYRIVNFYLPITGRY